MRLIDADALIEAIRNHYENVHCEDAVLNNFYRLAHEHVIDVVNVQKTAFDVEKVVAELETSLKATRNSQTYDCLKNNGYGTPTQAKNSGKIESLIKAIDIVRKGGIE